MDPFLEPTASSFASSGPVTSQTVPYSRLSFEYAKNPYFAMLSEPEKDAYSVIYEEVSKGKQTFECPVKINADELAKALDAVQDDHPELFWIDNTYSYTYDPDDGSIYEITVDFFDFADTPEKLAEAKTRFNSEADSIIAKAVTYQTEIERELFIHDYICQNTTYDSSAPYNQSAYSVIVNHKSVCAGYARGAQYLLIQAGITCYYVTGKTDGVSNQAVGGSDSDGSHSWDMVLLGGAFYNLDCLWDDTASDTYGSAIYPFFNLNDAELRFHVRTGLAVNLPRCSATECKYSNKFGSTVEADSITFV